MPALGVAKTIGATAPSAHHRSNRGWQSTRRCRLPPPPIRTTHNGNGPEPGGTISAYSTGSGRLPDESSDNSMLDGIRDALQVIRHDDGLIAVGGGDFHAARRFQFTGVIAINIIGVLQHVTGEHRDYVGIVRNG